MNEAPPTELTIDFRGKPTVIQYRYYLRPDGEEAARWWFKCLRTDCADLDECDCQPEINQVEDLEIMADIACDVRERERSP